MLISAASFRTISKRVEWGHRLFRSTLCMLSIADYEAHAKRVLDSNTWYYYSSGAKQEQTLKDNMEAYKRYRLRPRILQDVTNIDMRVRLFNDHVELPICVSPTAMHGLIDHEGEVATARACSKLGTCMTLSTWSTASLEEVASVNEGAVKWFQIFPYEKTVIKKLIQRAERAGYKALVVTVDSPVDGQSLKETVTFPSHLMLGNLKEATDDELKHNVWTDPRFEYAINDWSYIDWLRETTQLPIVAKGILTREDAVEAVKHGVQGIQVSNHGGRQLDGVPATIDVLSEVVEAVGDKVEVFLDGGVRQGTDVLKALALGAKAVFIGRPVLWGLAYKGSEGVENVLTILRDELELAMMLAGCARVVDISSNLVVHESYYKMK